MRRKPGRRALLDGNFARHMLPLRETEYCIWDTELAGFGLRIRPTGKCYWFVWLRHRGKHRRITVGRSDELAAELARAHANHQSTARYAHLDDEHLMDAAQQVGDAVQNLLAL